MIDTQELRQRVDIAALVESDLGPSMSKSGRWQLWLCPFHADSKTPSLAVTSDNGRWYCFGACGTGGDAIDWLRRRHGLSFQEACKALGGLDLSAPSRPVQRQQGQQLPSAIWQERAATLVFAAEHILWMPTGVPGLEHLRWRGLADETIQRWRLGYLPEGWSNPKATAGIIIPAMGLASEILSVKVRRLTRDGPKYSQAVGSKAALFGLWTLIGKATGLICEGELDAIRAWQDVGDLVATVSGTAGAGAWRSDWNINLVSCRRLLVAYDVDTAGRRGATTLTDAWKRARRVRPLWGKDLTEFAQQGGDLRTWMQALIGADTPANANCQEPSG